MENEGRCKGLGAGGAGGVSEEPRGGWNPGVPRVRGGKLAVVTCHTYVFFLEACIPEQDAGHKYKCKHELSGAESL